MKPAQYADVRGAIFQKLEWQPRDNKRNLFPDFRNLILISDEEIQGNEKHFYIVQYRTNTMKPVPLATR